MVAAMTSTAAIGVSFGIAALPGSTSVCAAITMGTWHAGVLHGSGGWDKSNLGAALEV